MAGRLERLFEYRNLVATPGADPARVANLRDLLQPGVPALDDRNPYTCLPEAMKLEVACAGQRVVGQLCNVAADGLAIALNPPPPLAQRVHVHIHDRQGGHAYTFTGHVVARVVSGVPGIGVALDGLATQTRLSSGASGVYISSEHDDTKVTRRRGITGR